MLQKPSGDAHLHPGNSKESLMPQRPIRELIHQKRQKGILLVPAKATVTDAAQMMQKRNIGAVIVVDEHGHLAGIFTERDALFRVLAQARDPAKTRIAQVMTKNPRTVEPDKPVGYALHMMYEGGFRHVPVVENGRPVGMVAARDALGPELKEFESDIERREHIGEILG
jgi:CBS domain-containing protein